MPPLPTLYFLLLLHEGNIIWIFKFKMSDLNEDLDLVIKSSSFSLTRKQSHHLIGQFLLEGWIGCLTLGDIIWLQRGFVATGALFTLKQMLCDQGKIARGCVTSRYKFVNTCSWCTWVCSAVVDVLPLALDWFQYGEVLQILDTSRK